MKTLRIFTLAVLATFGFAAHSNAQSSDGTDVTVSARAVSPVHITKSADLSFGSFAPGASCCIITVGAPAPSSAIGGATYNPTHRAVVADGCGAPDCSLITQLHSGDKSPSACDLSLTGEPTFSFTVDCPSTCTVSDGSSHTMSVDLASWSFGASNSGSFSSQGGSARCVVWGKLHVAGAQASGLYSGSFHVTVTMQ